MTTLILSVSNFSNRERKTFKRELILGKIFNYGLLLVKEIV